MNAIIFGLLLFGLQSKQTELDRIIQRSSVYAKDYLLQLGSVVGEERYVQEADWEDSDTKGRPLHSHRQRQMVSDLLSLPVGDAWIGFRHVREVDGITVDPLYKGVVRESYDETTAEGQRQLREKLNFESIRYNIGDFARPANLPTFPLQFLEPDILKMFSFSKSGEEDVAGVHTWRIRFTGRLADSFLMSSGIGPPVRVSLSGAFWIEPMSGRIFRCEVTFADSRSQKTEMRLQVRFKNDSAVGLVVPVYMEEHFLDPLLHHELKGNADYLNFRHFETRVQLRDPADFPNGSSPESDLKRRTWDSYGIKVDVHLIDVNAWVSATTGLPVTDLQAGDFKVLENRIEQTITNFSTVDTPYDVLLLFDHSGSTVTEWEVMQQAAQQFSSSLRSQDRVGIANFDTSLRMLTRWTETRQQVTKTIAGLQEGKRPGGTNFYRAVEQAVAAELPPVAGRRRALVILSDGRDNGLFRILMNEGTLLAPQEEPEFQQMISLIRRERIPIYVVAVNGTSHDDEVVRLDERFRTSVTQDYLEGVRIRLEAIAETSGGRVIFSDKLEDVIPLYRQISQELGTAYSIGYVSNLPTSVEGFREITVLAQDQRLHVVQSRQGYRLEPGPQQ